MRVNDDVSKKTRETSSRGSSLMGFRGRPSKATRSCMEPLTFQWCDGKEVVYVEDDEVEDEDQPEELQRGAQIMGDVQGQRSGGSNRLPSLSSRRAHSGAGVIQKGIPTPGSSRQGLINGDEGLRNGCGPALTKGKQMMTTVSNTGHLDEEQFTDGRGRSVSNTGHLDEEQLTDGRGRGNSRRQRTKNRENVHVSRREVYGAHNCVSAQHQKSRKVNKYQSHEISSDDADDPKGFGARKNIQQTGEQKFRFEEEDGERDEEEEEYVYEEEGEEREDNEIDIFGHEKKFKVKFQRLKFGGEQPRQQRSPLHQGEMCEEYGPYPVAKVQGSSHREPYGTGRERKDEGIMPRQDRMHNGWPSYSDDSLGAAQDVTQHNHRVTTQVGIAGKGNASTARAVGRGNNRLKRTRQARFDDHVQRYGSGRLGRDNLVDRGLDTLDGPTNGEQGHEALERVEEEKLQRKRNGKAEVLDIKRTPEPVEENVLAEAVKEGDKVSDGQYGGPPAKSRARTPDQESGGRPVGAAGEHACSSSSRQLESKQSQGAEHANGKSTHFANELTDDAVVGDESARKMDILSSTSKSMEPAALATRSKNAGHRTERQVGLAKGINEDKHPEADDPQQVATSCEGARTADPMRNEEEMGGGMPSSRDSLVENGGRAGETANCSSNEMGETIPHDDVDGLENDRQAGEARARMTGEGREDEGTEEQPGNSITTKSSKRLLTSPSGTTRNPSRKTHSVMEWDEGFGNPGPLKRSKTIMLSRTPEKTLQPRGQTLQHTSDQGALHPGKLVRSRLFHPQEDNETGALCADNMQEMNPLYVWTSGSPGQMEGRHPSSGSGSPRTKADAARTVMKEGGPPTMSTLKSFHAATASAQVSGLTVSEDYGGANDAARRYSEPGKGGAKGLAGDSEQSTLFEYQRERQVLEVETQKVVKRVHEELQRKLAAHEEWCKRLKDGIGKQFDRVEGRIRKLEENFDGAQHEARSKRQRLVMIADERLKMIRDWGEVERKSIKDCIADYIEKARKDLNGTGEVLKSELVGVKIALDGALGPLVNLVKEVPATGPINKPRVAQQSADGRGASQEAGTHGARNGGNTAEACKAPHLQAGEEEDEALNTQLVVEEGGVAKTQQQVVEEGDVAKTQQKVVEEGGVGKTQQQVVEEGGVAKSQHVEEGGVAKTEQEGTHVKAQVAHAGEVAELRLSPEGGDVMTKVVTEDGGSVETMLTSATC
ncbi:hypothetical protein CBR_g54416 [Chara braunii]|uniref:Uncharacterized protein n=1 Tax=Chara braunii TaxID=69332 RepID=A0A388MC27_CHABU|nr:hypothetical protein CBR_g54416 [Chara braunii]|eukprot:GBG92116.1 hypothetical protein CBR_g54416 [Chara braunii]